MGKIELAISPQMKNCLPPFVDVAILYPSFLRVKAPISSSEDSSGTKRSFLTSFLSTNDRSYSDLLGFRYLILENFVTCAGNHLRYAIVEGLFISTLDLFRFFEHERAVLAVKS